MNQKYCRVILRRDQAEALEKMQEKERQQSAHGLTPTIHAIARAVFDQVLQEQRQC